MVNALEKRTLQYAQGIAELQELVGAVQVEEEQLQYALQTAMGEIAEAMDVGGHAGHVILDTNAILLIHAL